MRNPVFLRSPFLHGLLGPSLIPLSTCFSFSPCVNATLFVSSQPYHLWCSQFLSNAALSQPRFSPSFTCNFAMEKVSAEICQKKTKLGEDHRTTTTMERLPSEISLDILSRLPIISLMQTKSVCHFLNKLTCDPVLVKMHFLRVSQNDPCLILHCDYPIENQLYLVHFSDQVDSKSNRTLKKIVLPRFPEFEVVGSCNGLLCLCDSPQRNAVYVYNPFIRKCMKLPRAEHNSEQKNVIIGFGFHPETQDYKVVRIVSDKNENGYYSEVKVFSHCGFTWRNIGQINYHLQPVSSNVFINGRLHWLACRETRQHYLQMIVSFDLSDEQFRRISLPNFDQNVLVSLQLVILQGCLSAAFYSRSSGIDLWIMKEYDVTDSDSWTKAFSIRVDQPFGSIDLMHARVLCILISGEILMEYKHRALVSYDPESRKFDQIMFPGSKLPHWFEATVHIGCLNWIDSNIYSL